MVNEKKKTPKKKQKILLKELPLTRLIPNIATVMALCTGLTGIHFAMMGRFEMAVGAIIIAGILDVIDGRLARLLGVQSDFGAELDSLSDFVSFGVVPAVVTYMWVLHQWKGWGWGFCLFFVVCSGWRLARFNTYLRNPDTKVYRGYFMGVPAPMGAYVGLLPLIMGFSLNLKTPLLPILYGISLTVAGLLMISSIATFSTKTLTLSRRMLFPFLVMLGIAFMALLNAPWEVLSLCGIGYLLSLPISYLKFMRGHKHLPPKGND